MFWVAISIVFAIALASENATVICDAENDVGNTQSDAGLWSDLVSWMRRHGAEVHDAVQIGFRPIVGGRLRGVFLSQDVTDDLTWSRKTFIDPKIDEMQSKHVFRLALKS